MSMPDSPSDPKATAATPAGAATALSFAESLDLFWAKHRSTLLAACVGVMLAIVGVGVYHLYVDRREAGIAKEYAAAGNDAQKLKSFAEDHSGHMLAGVAMLRVADQDYAAGKYADAQAAYEKAVGQLGKAPFSARAKLGLAMSQLLGGKITEGEAGLKQIADDVAQFKGIRAEAAFHLLSRDVELGKKDEAVKLVDQILQVDGAGVWAQRAIALRASLGTAEAASAKPATNAGSEIKVKIPGQ